MGKAEALRKDLRLRSFARSGRAEKHDDAA
jgi:hypothetical protein